MRTENYKCEDCKYIHEVIVESHEDLPKRDDCPKCGKKKICYRVWGIGSGGIIIPDHMKAVNENKGYSIARERFKKYKGAGRTQKRFH